MDFAFIDLGAARAHTQSIGCPKGCESLTILDDRD